MRDEEKTVYIPGSSSKKKSGLSSLNEFLSVVKNSLSLLCSLLSQLKKSHHLSFVHSSQWKTSPKENILSFKNLPTATLLQLLFSLPFFLDLSSQPSLSQPHFFLSLSPFFCPISSAATFFCFTPSAATFFCFTPSAATFSTPLLLQLQKARLIPHGH